MPSFVLPVLLCAGLILCLSTPVAAFGAGNIINVSQVAGKNWRHGDIEDVLLELLISTSGGTRFDKLAVKRVYFVCLSSPCELPTGAAADTPV